MKKKLVLIGFPGAGKTTTGRALEERFGCKWQDLDELIEASSKRSITEIIREDGEQRFRSLEKQALKDAINSELDVISLGGGALLAAENQKLLREKAVVVLLKVSAEEAAKRIAVEEKQVYEQTGQVKRPLLAQKGKGFSYEILLEKVAQLTAEREKVYAISDVEIDTDTLSSEEIPKAVYQIMLKLKEVQ